MGVHQSSGTAATAMRECVTCRTLSLYVQLCAASTPNVDSLGFGGWPFTHTPSSTHVHTGWAKHTNGTHVSPQALPLACPFPSTLDSWSAWGALMGQGARRRTHLSAARPSAPGPTGRTHDGPLLAARSLDASLATGGAGREASLTSASRSRRISSSNSVVSSSMPAAVRAGQATVALTAPCSPPTLALVQAEIGLLCGPPPGRSYTPRRHSE